MAEGPSEKKTLLLIALKLLRMYRKSKRGVASDGPIPVLPRSPAGQEAPPPSTRSHTLIDVNLYSDGRQCIFFLLFLFHRHGRSLLLKNTPTVLGDFAAF